MNPASFAGGGLLGAAQTIPNIDSLCSAIPLLKHHGQDAPIHATMLADALLDKGVLAGYGVWRRILRAVQELQRTEPGSRVNRGQFTISSRKKADLILSRYCDSRLITHCNNYKNL